MSHLQHLNRELVRDLIVARSPSEIVNGLSQDAIVELRALHHFGRRRASKAELPTYIDDASRIRGEPLGDFGRRSSLPKYLRVAYSTLWPDSPLPANGSKRAKDRP